MKDEVLQSMKERRSIRAYEDRQISETELSAILEAGIWAPTGMGLQSPKIVVVQDRATRDELSRLNARILGVDSDPFYGAPTVLIIFADSQRSTYLEDGSLVLGNLMLGAYAVGLGSCWIHRAREVFALPEGKAFMKKWGISENYVGIGHCILGYSAGAMPQPKPRKSDYVIRVS